MSQLFRAIALEVRFSHQVGWTREQWARAQVFTL